MLCLHPPFCVRDTSSHHPASFSSSIYTPLRHHNGMHTPFRHPLQKAQQLRDMDLEFSVCGCTPRNPRRRACQAICFKDEISSFSANTLGFRDEASFVAPEVSISCTTFNILAPIYKRVNGEGFRESEEFWLGSEELTHLYDENLCQADYLTYKLARTNGRGDGLLTAIKSARLRVLNYEELLFNDCGDRVAQFFHLRSKWPDFQRSQNPEMELLLVNTHLLFPHDFNYCLVRLRQVYKILRFIEQYKIEHGLTSIPVILCGDWNGSKRGRVYKFLRSQGYLSSYDTAHDYTDSDSRRWISHKNHRGNICEVDFIWLLNPDTYQRPLTASWNEAVLGTIKAKLSQIGLKGRDAFYFFLSEGSNNVVTLQEFQQGLQLLGLTESCSDACSEGLTKMEINQLMEVVDIDGNGVIDYNEFETLLAVEGTDLVSPRESLGISSLYYDASTGTMKEMIPRSQTANLLKVNDSLMQNGRKLNRHQSFSIKEAFLFPPEVETGVWPEKYSLSDHAALTVTFSLPRELHGMHLIA